MSFLTGVKAIEPSTSARLSIDWHDASLHDYSIPNKVERDSDASKNSVVEMALSLLSSTGTSTKDLFSVSNQVPPAGYEKFDGTAMFCRK